MMSMLRTFRIYWQAQYLLANLEEHSAKGRVVAAEVSCRQTVGTN